MITEDYVSFEIAKLLKEKRFNEKCRYVYDKNGNMISSECFMEGESFIDNNGIELTAKYDGWNTDTQGIYAFLCPTLQMAIKWLNEVHHILVVSDYEYEFTDTSWYYKIYKLVDEHGECESWPVNAVRDIDGLEVTVAFRDYMRSYKDYATREEAEEGGIRYVLENLI